MSPWLSSIIFIFEEGRLLCTSSYHDAQSVQRNIEKNGKAFLIIILAWVSCNFNCHPWKKTCFCPVWQRAGSHHSLDWAANSRASLGWSRGGRGLKGGGSYGTRGKGGQVAVHFVCGLVPTTPGAEELCPWEPTCAHASDSHAGVQDLGRCNLFNKALKLVSKRHEGDYSASCYNSGKVSTVQVCSSLTWVCWEDAEMLEGLRPRFCCHRILEHWVHVADEGIS